MSNKYPNSGTLGKNDKPKNENSPTYTGKAEIEGVEYWINAWVKEGPSGKFFSLSFKAKEEAHKQGMQSARKAAEPDDDLTDVPF